MKYTLVRPDGSIAQSREFDTTPPALAPVKGKWLPDNPPAYNPLTHSCVRAEIQPFNATEVAYNVTPRSLRVVQDEKIIQLEQARDETSRLDVLALGTQWQADERSQKLLSSAITLAVAGLPLPTEWRDSMNNNVPIASINQLLTIAGAMAVQTQDSYIKSWQKKAEVELATTVEQVSSVTW